MRSSFSKSNRDYKNKVHLHGLRKIENFLQPGSTGLVPVAATARLSEADLSGTVVFSQPDAQMSTFQTSSKL